MTSPVTTRSAVGRIGQDQRLGKRPRQLTQVRCVGPNTVHDREPAGEGDDQRGGSPRLGRSLGEPEEIGELIAFLVSGRSRFTTGQTIYFTGGWP